MAAKELVEYVARSLVDDPDAVKVEVVRDEGGRPSGIIRLQDILRARIL